MPRISAARVKCPRPEHAGSRVKLEGTYGPRRYALKNRERPNRLLMLQQLHLNGDDDVQT